MTAYHLSSLAATARDSLRLERESTHPCKRAHFGPHWHGRLLKEKGIPPLHAHHPTSCNQKPSMTSAPRGLNPSRIRQNVPRFKKCGMILIRVWAHGRCAETTGMLLVPVWAGVTQQFFFLKTCYWIHFPEFLKGPEKQKKKRQTKALSSAPSIKSWESYSEAGQHVIFFTSNITPLTRVINQKWH